MSVNKSNMWPNLIGILVCSQAVIHLELFFIRATSVILSFENVKGQIHRRASPYDLYSSPQSLVDSINRLLI